MANRLFYGDNLEVLRGRDADGRPLIADESVDLVYLDPPFNSAASYNVLFRAPDGKTSDSSVEAFEDTWHWGDGAARAYHEVVTGRHQRAGTLLRAMRDALGENDLMAYLAMIAVRLIELHRVLKPSGSLYLHCDPTASHYLKVVLDGVFGAENFRNELVWRRSAAHNSVKSQYGPIHDTILFYSRDAERMVFHAPRVAPDPGWIEREYRYSDDLGRYSLDNLTASGTCKGPSGLPWRGVDPRRVGIGRHWRFHPDTLEKLDAEGRIYWPKKTGGYPKLKQYLSDSKGSAVGDVWTDIAVLGRTASERLGYPTQKPVALLERILVASSNPGDLVLDPFCGCRTTVHAAQKLGRRWIGIDVTHLAVSLIERRLGDAFPGIAFEVHGVPRDLAGARDLAARDKHQFQWWAVSLVDAVPQDGKRKGADRGVDGVRWVKTGSRPEDLDRLLVSVKGGENVSVRDVRDLAGTIQREGALGGVLVTLAPPTRDMLREAASHGYAESGLGRFRRIMVKTVEELLRGVHDEGEALPPVGRQEGFRRAARERAKGPGQPALDL